jgi:hypothetical protein
VLGFAQQEGKRRGRPLLPTLKSQTKVTMILSGCNWKRTVARESIFLCTHFARQVLYDKGIPVLMELPEIKSSKGIHLERRISLNSTLSVSVEQSRCQ